VCLVGAMGALRYVIIGAVIAVVVVAIALVLLLQTPHRAPVQYVGSPSGYEAFVPNGQTINYDGQTDPVGYLILYSKTNNTLMEIPNVIWAGRYADTIINNHNQIDQLNSQFVGQIDPINHQPYVPLQDFYVIDANNSQVPIQQTTIGGQTYYVIDANNINPANIAGFYTYQGWVTDFVKAMNTPETYAAVLPGNSPVFQWENLTGTVAYQTMMLPGLGSGSYIIVLSNGTIIPYGSYINVPGGMPLLNFTAPYKVYNFSS